MKNAIELQANINNCIRAIESFRKDYPGMADVEMTMIVSDCSDGAIFEIAKKEGVEVKEPDAFAPFHWFHINVGENSAVAAHGEKKEREVLWK